ncbi:MAG: DUF1489 domain-containing protein [Pseudomonadota bacterium]
MNSESGGQGALHLIKLCVGIDHPDQLAEWQAKRALQGKPKFWHVTRMWPRREAELLDGGSLYWVMRGSIACRQRIISLEETRGEDGVRRCKINFDPEIVLTARAPRRAFQGWRYLTLEDAPSDLGPIHAEREFPDDLLSTLDSIGVR